MKEKNKMPVVSGAPIKMPALIFRKATVAITFSGMNKKSLINLKRLRFPYGHANRTKLYSISSN